MQGGTGERGVATGVVCSFHVACHVPTSERRPTGKAESPFSDPKPPEFFPPLAYAPRLQLENMSNSKASPF